MSDAPAEDRLAELIGQVTSAVRDKYPTATTLMAVEGTAPDGPTTDMSKVTDWHFVFNETDGRHMVEANATIDGTISEIAQRDGHWGGVQAIKVCPKMTMNDAYELLRNAGHKEPFQYVSLVHTLDAQPHLLYRFENGFPGSGKGYDVYIEDGSVHPIWGSDMEQQ